jgi:hypothetical protein
MAPRVQKPFSFAKFYADQAAALKRQRVRDFYHRKPDKPQFDCGTEVAIFDPTKNGWIVVNKATRQQNTPFVPLPAVASSESLVPLSQVRQNGVNKHPLISNPVVFSNKPTSAGEDDKENATSPNIRRQLGPRQSLFIKRKPLSVVGKNNISSEVNPIPAPQPTDLRRVEASRVAKIRKTSCPLKIGYKDGSSKVVMEKIGVPKYLFLMGEEKVWGDLPKYA